MRTNATANYFDIDTTMLDLTASDYVLRSINSALRPIILFLVLFAFLQVLHRRMRTALIQPRHHRHRLARATINTAGPIGTGLLLIGTAVLLTWDDPIWPLGATAPLGILVGATLLAYHQKETNHNHHPKTNQKFGTLALVSLGLFGFLLTIEQYASHVGQTIAVNDAANLPSRPAILLHSTKQLDIVGDGISLSYDPSPEQNYHYRYSGLRQLLHTRSRYFLVSANWNHDSSAVFCIQDNDSVRIDFIGTQ
ncbi:MAG TPA: hypothetical protein VFG15_00790 [Amycolatopsis sp.]|nr:hypothetical protein [Amycolatopsis sp.]